MNKDEILLKKWELLWNHYKLQNECVEKRRNFLWIIQALIFTGWYHSYKDRCLIDLYIANILSIAGFLISLIWLFVLNRERHSILITEMALRDVEVECNNLYSDVGFNRFILDKVLLKTKGDHKFKYIDDQINKPGILEKYSASNILNKFIPIIIAILWMFIIFSTSGVLITYILLVIVFLIWVILSLHVQK